MVKENKKLDTESFGAAIRNKEFDKICQALGDLPRRFYANMHDGGVGKFFNSFYHFRGPAAPHWARKHITEDMEGYFESTLWEILMKYNGKTDPCWYFWYFLPLMLGNHYKRFVRMVTKEIISDLEMFE